MTEPAPPGVAPDNSGGSISQNGSNDHDHHNVDLSVDHIPIISSEQDWVLDGGCQWNNIYDVLHEPFHAIQPKFSQGSTILSGFFVP
ncbi:hypothetical protein ZWY2020_050453 [Hordeum vulgare]|nr:hypothetical protein ZWY2020_050453 [Hordeum vulgare]